MGGGYGYTSPSTTLIQRNCRQSICVVSPNTVPDMGWGGEYNDEPTD